MATEPNPNADDVAEIERMTGWAAKYFEALYNVRRRIEEIDADVWTQGESDGSPLWRALEDIDKIVVGTVGNWDPDPEPIDGDA